MSDGRQNSLLTTAFRELIRSDPERTQQERKNRKRMRERVKEGLADVALLNQFARETDIEQIFRRKNNQNDAQPTQGVDRRQEILSNRWVAARHMIALAWRGLRLNGVDKDELFERVIVRGIEDGEADYSGVPHGRVESDIRLEELNAAQNWDELDPVEKWQRNLSLGGDDLRELQNRLSEHPEVESIVDGDMGELIDQYLVEE